MHIHWLQHAEYEDLGCISPWLEAHGHTHAATLLHQGERPPGIETFDALIVLGGPMNIYEYEKYPWLVEEKTLIRIAIDAGRRVLGICLGSQLIADVLATPGEPNVVRNGETELGFYPVTPSAEGRQHPLFKGLGETFTAFHWHGDTYRLPPGAVNLASSAVCSQQAFAYDGSRVLGMQFHPELTQANAPNWFKDLPAEHGPWVQTPETVLANDAGFAANNAAMAIVLQNFFGD